MNKEQKLKARKEKEERKLKMQKLREEQEKIKADKAAKEKKELDSTKMPEKNQEWIAIWPVGKGFKRNKVKVSGQVFKIDDANSWKDNAYLCILDEQKFIIQGSCFEKRVL